MSLRDDPAYRAHSIIFGHWQGRLEPWFDKLAPSSIIPFDQRIKPKLVDALFNAQRTVLEHAVDVDLRIFSKSEALYRDLSKQTADLEALFGQLGDSRALQDLSLTAPRGRNHAEAYGFYCTDILNPPPYRSQLKNRKQSPPPPLGIPAFLRRQPHATTLLDRVYKNFTANMDECLQRVRADRTALERCFLGGKIDRISDIVVSDSDPHKGGKRVVFLTFEYKPASGGTATKRVVYKPSDLEIDYRLAGRNSPELSAFLASREETAERNGYPAPPYESLYEWLDRVVLAGFNDHEAESMVVKKGAPGTPAFEAERNRVRAMLTLPSYLILPRNPGSRMTEQGGALPIERSYGYMEYLTYEPSLPPTPRTHSDSDFQEAMITHAADEVRSLGKISSDWDWITVDLLEARTNSKLWGRLMMIAFVFLQTDVHHENQRIRRRKPHLIDLENCLVKEAPDPQATLMYPAFDRAAHGCPVEWRADRRAASDDGKTPLELKPSYAPNGFNVNQLYLASPPPESDRPWQGNAWRVGLFDYPRQPPDLNGGPFRVAKGIFECLVALRFHRAEVRQWPAIAHLGECIVRLVPRQTTVFQAAVREFVKSLLESQLSPDQPPPTEADVLKKFVEKQKKEAKKEWKAEREPKSNECYKLENLDINGIDYKNLDIPAWYRKVDSKALISTHLRHVDGYFETSGSELLDSSFRRKFDSSTDETSELAKKFTRFLNLYASPVVK